MPATLVERQLQVGSQVNFVVSEGVTRPLTVVRIWNKDIGLVNGIQLRDGSNDKEYDNVADSNQLQIWRTSVKYDADGGVNTWHWPSLAVPAAPAQDAANDVEDLPKAAQSAD